ncbi:hypothetical protein EDD27_9786 [Nonomuraea polychroma]|uniref:SH3 domain-containing protein n=1 Tax=Nonomuraea polychroma TaxID=46176 RepID=A0A438MM84_9ACTN|nr:hypothetical protein [Nonomuraea polychroma]RVX46874.1 hypothetical protein EDD27_9786 [Nonomuraea polychroma]
MRFQTLAISALTLLAVPLLPPHSATAATGCPRPATANVDSGWGIMRGAYNLKKGPYAGPVCGTVTKVPQGKVLYFLCWTKNSHNHLWVYARVKGTKTHGWMSVDNLKVVKTDHYRLCR